MAHLVDIGGGHQLRDDAAAAYLAMRRDGCPAGITSSTRSYARQTDLYRNQGRPGWPALADNPDRSKHVWRPDDRRDTGARALDLPEPARAWVRARGHFYGWRKDRVRGEVWHMEYEGGGSLVMRPLPPTIAAPVPAPPAPITPISPVEEIMAKPSFVQVVEPDGTVLDPVYLCDVAGGVFWQIPGDGTYEALIVTAAEPIPLRRVNGVEADRARRAAVAVRDNPVIR